MAQTDRYALSAVFAYEVQGNSLALMDKTEQGLERIESGVIRLRDTLKNSGVAQAFAQMFGGNTQAAQVASAAVQQATSQTNRAASQVKSAAQTAAQAIAPIKAEFKTLQAEARNIDFGDLQDPHAFDAAKQAIHSYIAELDKLESQIQGDSLAERELKAQLQSAKMGAGARVDKADAQKGSLDAADKAMQNAQIVGKFQQIQSVGQGITGFFEQPREEAAAFGQELAGIGKLADFGSTGTAAGMQKMTDAILQQSTAISTNRNLVSGVYEDLASAGKSFENFDAIQAEADAVLKNAAALDISTDAATGLDVQMGKVYQTSLQMYGGITGLNRSAGSAINALADNLANVKIDGQGVTQTFAEMVGFLGDAQNFKPPDIAAMAAVMNSIGVAPTESTSFMGRLDAAISAHTTQFAQALGLTVDQLSANINKDKYDVYQKIFASFGKVQGGDLMKAQFLTNLGVGAAGDQAIIKKLSGSLQVMTDARSVANKAFKEGTSVTDEFGRVSKSGTFQTEKAALALKNLKTQMGLAVNNALLPFVTAAATVMEKLLLWSQAHPKLTQAVAVTVFGLGVAAVAIGTMGIALFGLRQALLESQLAMNLLKSGGLGPVTNFFSTATQSIGQAGFAGALTQLGAKFGALQATFASGGIQGVVTSLTGGLTGVTAAFEGIAATITGVLSTPLATTIGLILGIYAAIELLTPGFNVLGAALSIVAAPFGLLFGLIKGITEGIVIGLKPAFIAVMSLLAPVGMAIGSVFGGIPQALQQAIGSFTTFASIGEAVGQFIGQALVVPFTIIGNAINLAISGIKLVVSLVNGALSPVAALANMLPWGKKKDDKATVAAAETPPTPPPPTGPSLNDLTSGVNAYFGVNAFTGIEEATTQATAEVKAGMAQVAAAADTPIAKTSRVELSFRTLLNPLELVQFTLQSIGDVITGVFMLPLRIVKSIADSITTAFQAITEAVTKAGTAVTNTLLAPVRSVQGAGDKLKSLLGIKPEKKDETPIAVAATPPSPPSPPASPVSTVVTAAGSVIPAITPESMGATAVAMEPPELVKPEPYGQVDTSLSFQSIDAPEQAAWSGFAGWFGTQMDMVAQSAAETGVSVVDSLNHFPTVRIPIAWQGAVSRIRGLFTGWVGDSGEKGNILASIFQKVADFTFGVFNRATLSAALFGVTSVISLTPAWMIIGAIGVAVVAVATNFLGLRTIVTGVFQIIQGAFQALSAIAEGVLGILSGIGQVLGGIPAALTGDLSRIREGFTAMGDGIHTVFSGVATGVETALSGVTNIARGVVEGITQVFSGARFVFNLVDLETLPATLQALSERVIGVLRSLGDFTRSIVLEVGLSSLTSLPERVSAVFEQVRGVVSGAGEMIASAWSFLSARLDGVPVLREFVNWVDTLPAIFSGAIERIQEKWSGLTGAVGGFLNRLTGKSKQTGQKLVSDLAEASPGPTFAIRQKWLMTTKVIGTKLGELQGHAHEVGAKITQHLSPQSKLGDHLSKAGSSFGALGQIIGAVSPQLAAPLFMVSDLTSGFETLTETFPGLGAKVTQLGPKFMQFAGIAKSGFTQVGSVITSLTPIVMTQVGVMTSSLATLVAPLLPFVAIAGAVIGAVALIALAFRSNFLGIHTLVTGVLTGITTGVQWIGTAFANVVMTAANLLNPLGWISTAFRMLETGISFVLMPLRLFNLALTTISGLIDGIKTGIGLMGDTIQSVLVSPFQQVQTLVQGVKNRLTGKPTEEKVPPVAVPEVFQPSPILAPVMVSAMEQIAPVTAPSVAIPPIITPQITPPLTPPEAINPVVNTAPVAQWGQLWQVMSSIAQSALSQVSAIAQSTGTQLANAIPVDLLTQFQSGVAQVGQTFNLTTFSAIGFGAMALTSMSPILLVLGGIVLSVAAISTNFLGLRTTITGVIQVFSGLFTTLTGVLQIVGEVIATVFRLGQGITQVIGGIPSALRGDFSGLSAGFDTLAAAARQLVSGVSAGFTTIGDGISGMTTGILQVFRGMGEGITQIVHGIGATFNLLPEVVSAVGNTIKAAWSGLTGFIGGIDLTPSIEGVRMLPERINQFLSAIGERFQSGIEGIKGLWNGLTFTLPSIDLSGLNWVEEKVRSVMNIAVEIFTSGVNQVKSIFGTLSQIDQIPVLSGFMNLIRELPVFVESAIEKIKALWGGLGEKVSTVFGFLGGKSKRTGQELISNLAEASPGPTFAIRQKWGMTTKAIGTKLGELQEHAHTVGTKLTQHLSPETKLGDHLSKAGSGLGALGQILGAVSPQLAAPLFMVTDLVSGFETLTETFPGLGAKVTQLAPKFSQFAGVARSGISQVGSTIMRLTPIVLTQVGVMTSSLATLIAPLLPFIAIAGAVVGAVALIAIAFRSNFLGIRTFTTGVINGITTGIHLIGSAFMGVVNIAATLLNPLNWISTAFRFIETAIGFVLIPLQLFDSAAQSISTLIGGIGTGIQSLGGSIETVLVTPFQKAQGLIQGIKNLLPGAKTPEVSQAVTPQTTPAISPSIAAPLPAVIPPVITPPVVTSAIAPPPVISSAAPVIAQPIQTPMSAAPGVAPPVMAQVITPDVAPIQPTISPVIDLSPVTRWGQVWQVMSGMASMAIAQLGLTAQDAGTKLMNALPTDLIGTFKTGVAQVGQMFNWSAMSAAGFGVMTLTSMSPVVLILGGVVLGVIAIATNFLGLRTILGGVVQVFGGLFTAITGVLQIIGELIGAVIRLGQGVTQIIGGIPAALRGDFSGLSEGFTTLSSAASRLVSGVMSGFETIGSGMRGVGDGILQIFKGVGEGISQIVKGIANTFEIIPQVVNAVGDGIKAIWQGVSQFVGGINLAPSIDAIRELPERVGGFLTQVGDRFNGVVDWIRQGWDGLRLSLPSIDLSALNWVEEKARAVMTIAVDIFTGGVSQVRSIFGTLTQIDQIPILNGFVDLIWGLPGLVEGAIEKIKGLWSGLGEKVSGIFNFLGGKSKQTGQELISNLAEASPGPTFSIRQKWGMTADAIVGRFEELTGHAKVAGTQIGDQIGKGADHAKGKIGAIKDKLSAGLHSDGIHNVSKSLSSLGMVAANINPALAAPLFMVGDLVDAAQTLSETLPQAAGFFTGLMPQIQKFGGSISGLLPVISSTLMGGLEAFATFATGAITAIAPIVISFLPVIAAVGAVVAAVILLRRAFQTNFLGIRSIISGTFNALATIASVIASLLNPIQLVSGAWLGVETGIRILELPFLGILTITARFHEGITLISALISGLGATIETFLVAPFQKAQGLLSGLAKLIPGRKETAPETVATPAETATAPLTATVPSPVITPAITPVVQPVTASVMPQVVSPVTAPQPPIAQATPVIASTPATTPVPSAIAPPVSITPPLAQAAPMTTPEPPQGQWSGFGGWFMGLMSQITAVAGSSVARVAGIWNQGVAVISTHVANFGQTLMAITMTGVQSVTGLLNSIGSIGGKFLGAGLGAVTFGLTATTAFAPFLLILGGVAFAIFAIATNFLGVRGAINGVIQTVKGLVTTLSGVINLFGSILQTAIEAAQGVMQIFGSIPNALRGDFSGLIAGFEQVGAALSAGGERIALAFNTIGDGIRQSFSGVFNVVQSVLDGVLNLFGSFGDSIRISLSQIPEFFHQSMQQLGGFFDGVLGQIKASWNAVTDYLPAVFEGAIERIKALWSNVTGAVGGFLNKLTGKSKQTGKELISNLAEASPGPTFTIRQKWMALTGLMGEKFDEISAHAQTTGGKLASHLGNTKLGDGIHSSLSKLGGGFTSLGALISNFSPQLAAPFFLVNDLADSFTSLSEALPEAKKLIGEFAPKLSGIAEGAMKASAPIRGALSAGLGRITALLPVMQAGFMSMLPAIVSVGGSLFTALLPVLPIIAAVAGGIALFTLAFKSNFLGLRSILSGLGAAITIVMEAVTTLLDPFQLLADLGQIVMNVMGTAAEWVAGAWEGFSGFFSGIMGGLVQKGVKAGFGLINALNHNPTETIMGAWRHAVFTIIGLHGDLTTSAKHRGGEIGDIFTTIGAHVFGAGEAMAKGVGHVVGATARGLLFAFVPPLRSVFTAVTGFVGDATASATTHAQGLFGAISSMVIGKVNSAFSTLRYTVVTLGMSMFLSFGPVLLILGGVALAAILVGNNFLGLKTIVSGVFQAISGVVSGLIQVFRGVFQTIQGIVQAVIGLFRGDFDGFRAGVEQALGGVRLVFDGIGNSIRAVFGGAINFIRGVFQGIGQIVSRMGFNIESAIQPVKAVWDGFLNILMEIEAKIRGIGDAIAASPIGKFARAAGRVISGRESSMPEAQAAVNFDQALAETPPIAAKPSLIGRLFGKKTPTPEVTETPGVQTVEASVTPPIAQAKPTFFSRVFNRPSPAVATEPTPVEQVTQPGVMSEIAPPVPPVEQATSPTAAKSSPTEAATEGIGGNASTVANALASVVGAVNPMLGAMIGTVMSMVGSVMTLITTMPILMAQFTAMGGFSGILATSFGVVAGAAGTMWSAITGPLLPVIIGVGLVIAAIGGLYLAFTNNFGGLQDTVMGIWNGIVGTVMDAVNAVISTLSGVFNAVVQFLSPIVQVGVMVGGVIAGVLALSAVMTALGGVMGTIGAIFTVTGTILSGMGMIMTGIATGLGVIGTIASALIPVLMGGISAIGAALIPLAGAVITALLPLLPIIAAIGVALMILPPIFQFIGGIIGGVFNAFGQIFQSVADTIGAVWNGVMGRIVSVLSDVIAPFQAIFAVITGGVGQSAGQMDLMGQAINGVVSAIMMPFQILGFLLNGVITVIGWIAQGIMMAGGVILQFLSVPLQILGGVVAGIITILNQVWTGFLNLFVTIGNSVKPILDAFSGVGTSITNAFAPLFGGGAGGGNGIGGALSAIAGFVTNVLLIPFQILGAVLNGIFTVIGAIAQVIGFVLVPVVNAILVPFQALAGMLSGIFSFVGMMASAIAAPFQAIWGFIQGIGQAISGIPVIGGLLSAFTGGNQTPQGQPVAQYATGGQVPGSGNTDSHVALLTPGEFVMNPMASAMFGPLLESLNKGDTGVAAGMLGGPLGQLIAQSPLGGLLGQSKDAIASLLPPVPIPLPVPVGGGSGGGGVALPPVQINLDVGGITIQGVDTQGKERSPLDMATEILDTLAPQLERAVVDILRNMVEKTR